MVRSPAVPPLLCSAFLQLAACSTMPPESPQGQAREPPQAPPGAVVRDPDPVADFRAFLATEPGPGQVRVHLMDLMAERDPRTTEILIEVLREPPLDIQLLVDTCVYLANLGGPDATRALVEFAASRAVQRGDPELLAAALTAIGEADAEGQHEFLVGVARKFLDREESIARAAIRALAEGSRPRTVDDLVVLLEATEAPGDSEEARLRRISAKEEVAGALRTISGEDFPEDAKTWKEWWRRNRTTWRPPGQRTEPEADINAADAYRDEAYGFELKKPNRRWSFRRSESGIPSLVLEALYEGRRAAWVEVYVTGTRDSRSKTPEAMADEQATGIEGKFRELRMAEWNRAGELGGEHAVEQVLFGLHKDFDVVRMRNVYALKDETLYCLITCWRSGTPISLRDDIDAILGSFRWKQE